jgi:SMI1 / KNR4 family (SUKH-1)
MHGVLIVSGWKQLFKALGAKTEPGVAARELTAFENSHGLPLPLDLRELYQASNGLEIAGGAMVILPLEGVAEHRRGFQNWGIPDTWGYFPLTDTNDSNPQCVCCRGLLAGRVVRVFHDDVARLTYRDVRSFFDAVRSVLKLAENEDCDKDDAPSIYELPEDYADRAAPRSKDDVTTGLELLRLSEGMPADSVERNDALRFAIALLSGKEVEQLASLLDDNEYIREAAVARLEAIGTHEAKSAIRKHNTAITRFVNDCVQALKAAGIQVVEVSRHCPRLGPGTVWFNLPMWFDRRREPSIIPEIVERAKQLLEQNQSRKQR